MTQPVVDEPTKETEIPVGKDVEKIIGESQAEMSPPDKPMPEPIVTNRTVTPEPV